MKNSPNLEPIKHSVERLYKARQEKKQFEEYYNAVNKKEQLSISNFIFTNFPRGVEGFEIKLDDGIEHYTNHVTLNIKRIRRTKIVWNLDKLKEQLNKEAYKKVVKQEYYINDMPGLIEYLKSCGVSPKIFRGYIDKTEDVDIQALEDAFELGTIDRKSIKDCYTVEQGEPYIKITPKEK